jgi:hypothetical protein
MMWYSELTGVNGWCYSHVLLGADTRVRVTELRTLAGLSNECKMWLMRNNALFVVPQVTGTGWLDPGWYRVSVRCPDFIAWGRQGDFDVNAALDPFGLRLPTATPNSVVNGAIFELGRFGKELPYRKARRPAF